jgi:hypothetical protein
MIGLHYSNSFEIFCGFDGENNSDATIVVGQRCKS